MVIALGYDPQNDVALVTRGAWNIAQRLLAAQAHGEHLAGPQTFKPQFGAHEGHRADLAGDVEGVAGGIGGRGSGHVPNYTAPAGRCRVFRNA